MVKVKYKKRYRRKKIKKKKKLRISRRAIKAIFILCILGGIVWFLFFSSFFQVKSIEIYGQNPEIKKQLHQIIEKHIETQKILFLPTKTIFLLSTNKLTHLLQEQFPEISSIQIHKKYPQGIVVRYKPRTPFVNFCHHNQCFLMDKQGVIFKSGKNKDLVTVIDNQIDEIQLGNTPLTSKNKDLLWELIEEISSKINYSIKEIYLKGDTIEVVMNEGWKAIFDLNKDISYQTNILALFLENQLQEDKELEYIDLRFDKIFYKFK